MLSFQGLSLNKPSLNKSQAVSAPRVSTPATPRFGGDEFQRESLERYPNYAKLVEWEEKNREDLDRRNIFFLNRQLQTVNPELTVHLLMRAIYEMAQRRIADREELLNHHRKLGNWGGVKTLGLDKPIKGVNRLEILIKFPVIPQRKVIEDALDTLIKLEYLAPYDDEYLCFTNKAQELLGLPGFWLHPPVNRNHGGKA